MDDRSSATHSIVQLLQCRTGLTFTDSQRRLACRMIAERIAKIPQTDSDEYLRLLEWDSSEFNRLIDEVTVGETYFFRDIEQFIFIRRTIMPELRKRKADRIRVWSAGCSTGEEVYSLAILLEEERFPRNTYILGTDLSARALQQAAEGKYGAWSLRGNGSTMIFPYVNETNGEFCICDSVRKRVSFAQHNLAEDAYPDARTSQLDLILCRNVLIYLAGDIIKTIAARFFECLNDGGYLVTGAGDPLLDDFAPFETVVTGSGVYYRRPSTTQKHESTMPTDVAAIDTRNRRTERANIESNEVDGPNHESSFHLPNCDDDEIERTIRELDRSVKAHGPEVTEHRCRQFVQRFPLSCEVRYFHAVLLMELDRLEEASEAIQQVIYIDRKLAQAHFTLALLRQRRGDLDGALRSFRNTLDVGLDQPPDETVPLSAGDRYASLMKAAKLQLQRLSNRSP